MGNSFKVGRINTASHATFVIYLKSFRHLPVNLFIGQYVS
jgi:hypothetical protein